MKYQIVIPEHQVKRMPGEAILILLMARQRTFPPTLLTRLEQLVLSTLRQYPEGLTSHDLVALTGIDWNTISPRLAPLVRKHLVIDSGQRRKGPTKRPCIV